MRAHGEFELTQRGRLLISRLSGAWNEQGLLEYQSQYRPLVSRLIEQDRHSPWGKLVDLRDWETSPMDLIGPYQEFQKRCVENGCVAVAFITRLQLHRFMIDSAEFTCPVKVVETQAEALSWLAQQGIDLGGPANQPGD